MIKKTSIPKALIVSRFFLGLSMLLLSILHIKNYSIFAVTLLTLGLLTDIFDGIIARQLNVSTQALRRLDSTVDQVFFVVVTVATYIQSTAFFEENRTMLIVLIFFEAATYLLSFIKFQKEIATHTIGAKIWTLILLSTLIQVMVQQEATTLFAICFWVGIVTRLEIIGILLTLKEWTNDVPSLYHAVLLRHRKEIKRSKLFNG